MQFCDIECDTDYALKFAMTFPREWQNYGFNPFSKIFLLRSACCVGCDCPTGNCSDVTIKALNAINADPDGLFTADVIVGTVDVNDPVAVLAAIALTAPQIAALTEADPCPIIRITITPQTVAGFCDIPRNSYYPKTPVMDVSFVGTNCCVPAIVVVQSPVLANVLGVDLRADEYFDGGYEGNPGPMRLSQFGLPLGPTAYFADLTMGYHVVSLSYDNVSVPAGGGQAVNSMYTQVVFPFANSVALLSFVTALDLIVAHRNFEALLADATACPVDGTTVVSISEIDDPSLDGIG